MMKLYVDTVLNKEIMDTRAGSFPLTTSFVLAAAQSGFSQLKGAIDEFCIYDRTLSVAEIQESFQESPDFSSNILAKIPKGTTQIISTISWQGTGNINVTVESPYESYTEDTVPVYQKTAYSTSGDAMNMLNIKRLSISVATLTEDENWRIMLDYDDAKDFSITVEIQK